MAEQSASEQKYEVLFYQLVMSLHAAVMQHLGKIKNPFTNKIERNLEQARASIDMLDMIKVKTEANLSENERRLLERLISEAKLNYVAELDKDKKASESPPSEKPDASGGDKKDTEATET